MYLILLFNLITVTSFNFNYRLISNRIIKLNNEKLRQIDNELNTEKQKINKLLIEKNKILKNITGLILHNETYINDYLDKINNENIYDDFDENGYNNEYDYEFKPRPNKINYNIIINTNPNQNKNQKKDNIKTEIDRRLSEFERTLTKHVEDKLTKISETIIESVLGRVVEDKVNEKVKLKIKEIKKILE